MGVVAWVRIDRRRCVWRVCYKRTVAKGRALRVTRLNEARFAVTYAGYIVYLPRYLGK